MREVGTRLQRALDKEHSTEVLEKGVFFRTCPWVAL